MKINNNSHNNFIVHYITMKFNKVNRPSDLVLANYNWWKNKGSSLQDGPESVKNEHLKGSLFQDNPFSCYDRDDIINENSYDDNIIIELNKYMITTDSQCGSCDDTYTSYHEACLPDRFDRFGIPTETLRQAVVREEQRAYVSGLMTYGLAIQLSSILDKNKYKNDFSYVMYRPQIGSNDKLIMGDIDFFNEYVPLTSEFVKLNSGEQIVLNVTNCPKIKSLLKYANSDINNFKNRLPQKKSKYIDKLVHVQFIMNKFCEKGLLEKLLAIFQSM